MKYTPLATTLLKVNDYHRLRIFVWPDIDTLQRATRDPGAGAKWERPEIRIWYGDDGTVRIVNRIIGRLHFYVNGFGAGVFAHELQHFIQDWIELKGIDVASPEAVPTLVQELTTAFWTWFYETFKETKTPPQGDQSA